MKTCSACGATTPLEAFHRDRTKPDGHRAQCQSCVRAAQLARDTALADARKAAEHEAYKASLRDRFGNRDWWAR